MCSCLVLLFFLLNPFRRTKDMVEKEPLYVSSKVKKKKYLLVKNGLIIFKELVLKWRIKFALTQNCVNAICCLFCLIPSLNSLLIFVLLGVICLALWYILARGQCCYLRCAVSLTPREPCQSCSSVHAACLTRLLLVTCRSFAASMSLRSPRPPAKHLSLERDTWKALSCYQGRHSGWWDKYFTLSIVFTVWSSVNGATNICCTPTYC